MALSSNPWRPLRQGRHQLVERLVEFLDSFVLELPTHIVDADAQYRQSIQYQAGFLDILFEPGFRLMLEAHNRQVPTLVAERIMHDMNHKELCAVFFEQAKLRSERLFGQCFVDLLTTKIRLTSFMGSPLCGGIYLS